MLGDLAVKNGGIRKLFSDYDLLGSFTAGSYVFTEKFIKQNPHTVKKFVEATAKAIEWAQYPIPRDQVIARYESIIKKRGRKEETNHAAILEKYRYCRERWSIFRKRNLKFG